MERCWLYPLDLRVVLETGHVNIHLVATARKRIKPKWDFPVLLLFT